MSSTVAGVDLRDFTHGSPSTRDAFVSTFGDSLAGTGFVRVAGHTIGDDTLAAAYRAAAEVFALPADVKAIYDATPTHGARGYIPFGVEQAKDATVVDLKEFWHIGRDTGTTTANVWPAEVPEFRTAMSMLFTAMDETASTLLEALALYLGLAPRALADLVVDADSLLRVLRYPPLRGARIDGAVRAAAHEDINFITLLPAATDAGLELRDRDGNWSAVDGLAGEVVVDSGDMLSRYLNGRIPATTHRVVKPADDTSERYSMPFFCQPRSDVVLRLPDELRLPGESLAAEPITAGEFHRERMEQIRLSK